jgi:hypothetical protein
LTFGTTGVVGRQPYAPAACTPRGIPWYSFLEAESTPGHMVQSVATEKIPSVTPPGIDPETFRLLAQCLNDNVEKYCRAGLSTDDSMAHAPGMTGTQGYKHTLRICNTCCFALRQWLHGRASLLSHSYTARLIRFSIHVQPGFGG